MIVTQDRAGDALRYLAETDKDLAAARGRVSACEFLVKRREAQAFMCVTGKNVEERKAKAKLEHDVEQAESELTDALVQFENLRAKRKTEEMIWETWRSEESSRRAGT